MKESEDINQYLDFERNLKKMWNRNVLAILKIFSILGTVLKGLKKRLLSLEIRGRTETLQTSELLRSGRILRRVLEF